MNHRDGAPKKKEAAIWVLMGLRGTALRRLSTRRLCARSDCFLNGGAKMLRLLVVHCPSQEVHDGSLHEGLTRSVRRVSYRLDCFAKWI